MKKIIDHIRKKPSHKKDQVIWIIIAIVVGGLLLLWLLIGNTKKETSQGKPIIDDFTDSVEINQNIFPDLFNQ